MPKKSIGSRIAASVRGRSSTEPKEPSEYKYGDIVLLGESGVGKTAIADRFVNNYFTEKYNPTDGQRTYEVNALIETEKENNKKGMVMKKSFKKSVMGNSRPPLKSKEGTKVKSVLSVRRTGEPPQVSDDSHAYQEGKAKGLKSLQFNLVDTPADMPEMEPITYQATISNAKGFLLVCSFDKPDSLEAVKKNYDDIKRIRNGIDKDTPIVLIANKREIDDQLKVVEELDVSEVAARLHIKWCVSDMSSPEGVAEMSGVMLNEINVAATQEEYLESLPEDQYLYVGEMIKEGEED